MFKVTHKGDFKPTRKFLKDAESREYLKNLDIQGRKGVAALQAATPRDTGETAGSWGYEIVNTERSIGIRWTNSVTVAGAPLAILLQYGHGTRNGGYVYGQDFINPAMKPVFDEISNDVWKLLTER
jgi:hypothetical protein